MPEKLTNNRKTLFVVSAAVHVLLIGWSFYQDSTSAVKYTDIDHVVFTDAARCLVQPQTPGCRYAAGHVRTGLGDPYSRDTYRYTPLLAILVSPNLIHPAFAKLLFSLCDLCIGLVLYKSLDAQVPYPDYLIASCWLLNPMIVTISTRGSAEAVLGVLVLSTLYCAQQQRWTLTACLFGLAVHFKIYPIIYGSSLLASMGGGFRLTRERTWFALTSFATFAILNVICFVIWGWPFVEHTFLYHIHRLDHRHNFSVYFYQMYLSSSEGRASSLSSNPLFSFLPQIGLAIGSGLVYGDQYLPFAWFIQTFLFVTFNKVCTSQYFLWYLWFLPLIIPAVKLSRYQWMSLLAVWAGTQGLWLSQAYRLEMLGQPVYFYVWASGIVFFSCNVYILGKLVEGFDGCKRVPHRMNEI